MLPLVTFAPYFKQGELSDVDFVIRLRLENHASEDEPAAKRAKLEAHEHGDVHQLAAFPGHRIILFTSEYFKAQAQNWQGSSPESSVQSSQRPTQAQRPTLQLLVDSEAHLPAAEAVIATMYGVTDAMNALEQQQLVHAAVIADMLQCAVAAERALRALKSAADSEQGLTAAALEALAAIAWPACCQQLLLSIVKHPNSCTSSTGAGLQALVAADTNKCMQRILVAVFGNLQGVWEDQQLQKLLLQLPLPALQLLLNADQLQVPSEDTVLYTAQQYVRSQAKASRSATTAALAPLVRAPHLSLKVMSWPVTSPATDLRSGQELLRAHMHQVQKLVSLRLTATDASFLQEAAAIHDSPASWGLGPRHIVPLADGVKVAWSVPVADIAAACKRSFATKKQAVLAGPNSAPLGGMAWQGVILCHQLDNATVVGVYVTPVRAPLGVYWRADCTISCASITRRLGGIRSRVNMHGWSRFFGDKLQPMSGGDGWDEAAWAKAGLPASGEMVLQLLMHEVW